MAGKAISYLRVSTAGQGRSGLGLEAQRAAVTKLAAQRDLIQLAEFTEVESGKRTDRPELQRALNMAQVTGSVLMIAKLDRLSRNASFLLALRDSGVKFVAADIPDANDLTIGVLAVIAQAEREAISRRTAEALEACRERLKREGSYISSRSGRRVERLGNPNGSAPLAKAARGNLAAVSAVQKDAAKRAERLRSIVEELLASVHSYDELAAELNARTIMTPRGRAWHAATARNVVMKLGLKRSD